MRVLGAPRPELVRGVSICIASDLFPLPNRSIRLARAVHARQLHFPPRDGIGPDRKRRAAGSPPTREKPLAEIEGRPRKLRALARQHSETDVENSGRSRPQGGELLKDLYKDLSPWGKPRWRAIPTGRIARITSVRRCSPNTRLWPGDRLLIDDAIMGGIAVQRQAGDGDRP